MFRIECNGSKWAGEAPDELEKLLERLECEPLDPRFEKYGNFISTEKTANEMLADHGLRLEYVKGLANAGRIVTNNGTPVEVKTGAFTGLLDYVFDNYNDNQPAPYTTFHGNFWALSAVFKICTDESEIINRLTTAIRANQQTEAYKEAKRQLAT